MEDDLYSIIEKKIKSAGSYDPIDVAEHFHIPVSRTTSSVIGFAFLYTPRTPVIGIHRDLDPMWYMFTGWHELGGHVFGGHVYEHTENGGLADVKLFTVDVDCRTIPRHEKEANLVSANVCVPDEDVLEAINYNNSAFQEFLDTKAEYDDMIKKLEQLKCTYSYQNIPKKTAKQMRDLRLEIRDYQEILHDLASDVICFWRNANVILYQIWVLSYLQATLDTKKGD